jgi:hypothetical protein
MRYLALGFQAFERILKDGGRHAKPPRNRGHRTSVATLVMAWVCTFAGNVSAAKAPLEPAELNRASDLILVGRIIETKIGVERSHSEPGWANYDWAIDLTLKIGSIGKGQLDPSDTIMVRCFRIKTRKSVMEYFTDGGNDPIPGVGQEVLAHLYQGEGLWRVVTPNGLQPLPNAPPLTNSPEISKLHSRRYTFGLPLELWFCLVVVWLVITGIIRLIKILRRPPATP